MTVSTITVTVSMPTSVQMLLRMHACHVTLLVRPSVTVSSWQLWLLPWQTPSSRTLQRSALQGRAKKTKAEGAGGRGLWGQVKTYSIGGHIVLCTAALRCTCALWRHVCFLLHVCTMKNIPGKCFTVPARVHCVGTRPRTSTRAGREQRVRAGVYVVCLTAL